MTQLTATDVLHLALAAGFSRADANVMVVISHAESAWNTESNGDLSLSKYGSIGLWQIFTGAHTPSEFGLGTSGWNKPLIADLFEPAVNAHAAKVVFDEQGFTAWSTYDNQHTTAAWAALLKTVESINATGASVPPPVVPPVLASSGKNYLAAKGNINPLGARAAEFEKKQIADGSAAWEDLCASLVRNAYGIPLSAWGKATRNAVGAWGLVYSKDRHSYYNAPYGTPYYWSGGASGAGHVAVADGLGNVWSNDFGPEGYVGDGKVRKLPLVDVHKFDTKLKPLGWSSTYLGVKVYA